MRIGYGFNRKERDFASADCDRVWVDTPDTDRSERAGLFSPAGLRPGDVLVLLAPGDLGFGGEIPIMRRALEDRGVTVEIAGVPKEGPARPRGRPPQFQPSEDQAKEIGALWHQPTVYTQAYVLRRAKEIMGHEVTRYQMNHRFGARDQAKR